MSAAMEQQARCGKCGVWRALDKYRRDSVGRLQKTCNTCLDRPSARANSKRHNRKCIHGKQKHHCAKCGGTSLCVHGRSRHRCVECGGAGVCEHKRLRYRCPLCKQLAAEGYFDAQPARLRAEEATPTPEMTLLEMEEHIRHTPAPNAHISRPRPQPVTPLTDDEVTQALAELGLE